MFENWGFLITEMIVLLLMAALIGLVTGWLLWGRRAAETVEMAQLRAELAACRASGADQAGEISRLEHELVGDDDMQPVEFETPSRPIPLAGPRDDGPDNLKLIKGVGPALEALVNGLGYYHFDQIAAWGPAEVAWVDEHLEGFKGRVSRDNWVEQAQILATGGTTKFANRQGESTQG